VPGDFGEVTAVALGASQCLIGTGSTVITIPSSDLGSPNRPVPLPSQAECAAYGGSGNHFSLQSESAEPTHDIEVFAIGGSEGHVCILLHLNAANTVFASIEAHPGAKTVRVWVDAKSCTACSLGSDSSLKTWKFGHKDGTLQLTQQCTLSGHIGSVTCAAFLSGYPILVTGGVDQTVRIWNLAQGECVHQLQRRSSACAHQHSVADTAVVSCLEMKTGVRATCISSDILGHFSMWVIDIPKHLLGHDSKKSEKEEDDQYTKLLRDIMGDAAHLGESKQGLNETTALLVAEFASQLGVNASDSTFITGASSHLWGPSLCQLTRMSNGQYFATALPASSLESQAKWWCAKLEVDELTHDLWSADRVLVADSAANKNVFCLQSHQSEIVWANWSKNFVFSVCRAGLLLVRESKTGVLFKAISLHKQAVTVCSSDLKDGMWIVVCHADASVTCISPDFDIRSFKLAGAGRCIWAKALPTHVIALQNIGCFNCFDTETGNAGYIQLFEQGGIRCATEVQVAQESVSAITLLTSGQDLTSRFWKLCFDDSQGTFSVTLLADVVPERVPDAAGVEAMIRHNSTGTAVSASVAQGKVMAHIGTWSGQVLRVSCESSALRGNKVCPSQAAKISQKKLISSFELPSAPTAPIQGVWEPQLTGPAVLSMTRAANRICVSDGDSISCLTNSAWAACDFEAGKASTISFISYVRDQIILSGWSTGKLQLLHLPADVDHPAAAGNGSFPAELVKQSSIAADPTPSARSSNRRQSTRSMLATSLEAEQDGTVRKNRSMRVSVAHLNPQTDSRRASMSESTAPTQRPPAADAHKAVQPTQLTSTLGKTENFQIQNPLAALSTLAPKTTRASSETGSRKSVADLPPKMSSQPVQRQRGPSAPPRVSATSKQRIKDLKKNQTANGAEQSPPRRPSLSPASAAHLHAPQDKRKVTQTSPLAAKAEDSNSTAERKPAVPLDRTVQVPVSQCEGAETVDIHLDAIATTDVGAAAAMPDLAQASAADLLPLSSSSAGSPSRPMSRTYSRRKQSQVLQPIAEAASVASPAPALPSNPVRELQQPASTGAVGTASQPLPPQAAAKSADLKAHTFDDLVLQTEASSPPTRRTGVDDAQSMVRRAAKPSLARRK